MFALRYVTTRSAPLCVTATQDMSLMKMGLLVMVSAGECSCNVLLCAMLFHDAVTYA